MLRLAKVSEVSFSALPGRLGWLGEDSMPGGLGDGSVPVLFLSLSWSACVYPRTLGHLLGPKFWGENHLDIFGPT